MSILNRIAGFVSPAWGLSRLRAQIALDNVNGLLGQARKFEAAGLGRRTDGWRTTSAGANAENRPALRLLRDRSRDLVRNNPFAKRAVQILGTNVVGSGIIPATVGKAKTDKTISAAWAAWAGTSSCDFDGLLGFAGIQRSVVRGTVESGEMLVIRKRLSAEETKRYGFPIQLQLLESDFLDTGRDSVSGESEGSRIIQGVEFDQRGRRVAYWLFKSHPGENTAWGDRQSVRIPAEDVLHIFEPLRPGQVRGIPFGVSAMLRLRDFDEYEDAQLVRQKIAACFAVFYNATEALDGLAGDKESKTENQHDIPDRVEPGMIEKLPAGSTVEMAVPPAALGYGEYSKTVLQSISVGFGVTYEQMTGDYSNVNYSSARMARMEFDGYIAELQSLIIIQFCAKVWEWFCQAAYLVGANKKPVVVPAKWTVPARLMVDPVKEVKALKDAVRAGFMSWSDAVLSLGNNPDALREAIVADQTEADRLKLELTTDPRKFADAGVPIGENTAPLAKSNS